MAFRKNLIWSLPFLSILIHRGGRFLISVTSFFCQKIILNKRKLLIIYVTYEINTCFHLNCWWSLSICVHMLPIWGSTLCVNNLTISLNHSIEDTYFDLIKNDMLHIFDINALLFWYRSRFYQIQGALQKLSYQKKNFVWTPCIKVLTKIVFVCFQGRRRFYQRRRETASYQRPPAQSMAAVWISRKFTACANRSHYLRFVLYVQHYLNDTGSPPLALWIPLAQLPLAPNLLRPCLIFWFHCVGYMLNLRQKWNYFFKLTFPPKNEQKNSISLLWDLFLFVFWRKLKTPKRHFKMNWLLKW